MKFIKFIAAFILVMTHGVLIAADDSEKKNLWYIDTPQGPKIIYAKDTQKPLPAYVQGEMPAHFSVIIKVGTSETKTNVSTIISEKDGCAFSANILDDQFILEVKLIPVHPSSSPKNSDQKSAKK